MVLFISTSNYALNANESIVCDKFISFSLSLRQGQNRASKTSHHRGANGNFKEGKRHNINDKHVLTASRTWTQNLLGLTEKAG